LGLSLPDRALHGGPLAFPFAAVMWEVTQKRERLPIESRGHESEQYGGRANPWDNPNPRFMGRFNDPTAWIGYSRHARIRNQTHRGAGEAWSEHR